jgi:hypothetical protein
MLHQVMRQRRRFAFALLLTQIALFDVWGQTAILAIMALGILAGMILVAASGHFFRRFIECGAIGVLAASRIPDPVMMATAFIAATLIAYALLYSPILDQLPFRIGMRSKKTFQVATDRRTTWSKLIPGQGHPAAYWTGTMLAVRTDAHDDDTLYITFENGTAPLEEITVTYLDLAPHHKASYLVEKDTLLAGEEIIMTYTLEEMDNKSTAITSQMRVSGLPIRHAVVRFFDDVLGDELDSFATMTSCKRTWHLRDTANIALTSELGRSDVSLAVPLPSDTVQEQPVQERLSA